MKKLQTPPFLNNLYRDMRDRRLLLPALGLIVALIAVPLALSSSAGTTPPPPAAAASGSGHEAATSPAVLTEQLGVTNYRKRLERLKSKNPFRLHFTGQSKGAKSDASSSADASSAIPTTASSSTPIAPTTSTASTSEGSTSPSSAPTSTSPPKSHEPQKPTVYVFRVDVAFGAPGDVTRRDGIEQGELLPRETKPMVAFVGASENGKQALFLLSDDVSSVSGDGRCLPGRNDCQLLKLKVGDEAKLAYAPEGDRTYRLKLLAIDLAPMKTNAGAG